MARYRQDPATGRLHLLTPRARTSVAPAIQPDLEPFVSPVDGRVIGSRRALREHNREHDVRQHREYGESEGQAYFARADRERMLRLTGQTRRDRAERLAAIIPIVERNEV